MTIKQGDLITIEITNLSNNGDGIGRYEGQVIFVPDTVTGDRIETRIVQVKKNYAQGKLQEILTPSPHRQRPQCIVADKCGGCQWLHIQEPYQHQAKQEQVTEIIQRIGEFESPQIAPILTSDSTLGYRNKVTYPLGRSQTGQIQAGYYRKNTHQLVNLNQCPVQDQHFNQILQEIKQDLAQQEWTIYNEQNHQGSLRHLSLRIGRRTQEILLTLVSKDYNLNNIEIQAQAWLDRYPNLVGVCVNYNEQPTNVIFGEKTVCIKGQDYLTEIFNGLKFQLKSDTFFQINTEVAESLLQVIINRLNLQGDEILLDAYCGIGTFTLPLAQKVKKAIGIEIYAPSITQAKINAQLNHLTNVTFEIGKVEQILPQLELTPHIVLLDPPRKGCDRQVIESLLQIKPERLVYISCNPATLARDLKLLCESDIYQLSYLQPADFFPQTPHVETVAFLEIFKHS
jgi:23S rRNA (uracil1939-C5)-methyltransferase